jgi:hypothetical protein
MALEDLFAYLQVGRGALRESKNDDGTSTAFALGVREWRPGGRTIAGHGPDAQSALEDLETNIRTAYKLPRNKTQGTIARAQSLGKRETFDFLGI